MIPRQPHIFEWDGSPADLLGRRWGTCCNAPDRNQIHKVEELTEEQRELDARRLGEHTGE